MGDWKVGATSPPTLLFHPTTAAAYASQQFQPTFSSNMHLRRYHHHRTRSLLAFLLLLPAALASTSCPYDLPYAAQIIPPQCYANATTSFAAAPSPSSAAVFASITSCCWFVFASYLYANIRHSNATGAAFLPAAVAARCAADFSSYLIRKGLVTPSLLLLPERCDLAAGSVRFAAGPRPCQFFTVAAVSSTADFSSARRDCSGGSPYRLTSSQSACVACQNAVIKSVFTLLDATGSKEIVACGMAATIGVWALAPPDPARFRSYSLCLVQVLENVGNLGTANFLPGSSPPLPLPSTTYTQIDFRSGSLVSAKLVAGVSVILGVLVSMVLALLCVSYTITRRRRWRGTTKLTTTATSKREDTSGFAASPLPREGIYIFTRSELKQATKGYDPRLVLGEGGSGKVYLGRLPSGQQVAIKRIGKKWKLDEFYREVEILARLRHPNLTTLLGYCLQEKEHLLVYEYMPGGNLSRALYHGGGLTWRQRLRIALDVAEGLAYLHELPDGAVVHRDVKPTNILLTSAGRAKLSDFGVSRVLPEGEASTEVRGTRGYVDPEYFAAGQVSEGADVYSYGVVLLELVTGLRAVVPTDSGGAESIVQRAYAAVADGREEVVDERMAGEGWDAAAAKEVFSLACRCVRMYRNERPRMREVVSVLRKALAEVEEEKDHGRKESAVVSCGGDRSCPRGGEVEGSEGEGSELGSPIFTSPTAGWKSV